MLSVIELCKTPHECGVCIGLYTLSSRHGLHMGCCIVKGVSERCVSRLLLTEYVVQVIMIIVYIAVVIIIMYFCCTKCRHTCTIFKYCFPFLPISHIIRMSHCTDFFVEVTNITKGNSIWAHFTVTGCFPIADMNIKTNPKGRCANRNFLLYI